MVKEIAYVLKLAHLTISKILKNKVKGTMKLFTRFKAIVIRLQKILLIRWRNYW